MGPGRAMRQCSVVPLQKYSMLVNRFDAGPSNLWEMGVTMFPRTATQPAEQPACAGTLGNSQCTREEHLPPTWPFPDASHTKLCHLSMFTLPLWRQEPPELVHAHLPGRIQFAQSSLTSPADAGQLSSFWHFQSYYRRVASRQKGHAQTPGHPGWHHGNHYLACTTWPKPSDLSVIFESGSPPPCPKAPRTSLELLVVQ